MEGGVEHAEDFEQKVKEYKMKGFQKFVNENDKSYWKRSDRVAN